MKFLENMIYFTLFVAVCFGVFSDGEFKRLPLMIEEGMGKFYESL